MFKIPFFINKILKNSFRILWVSLILLGLESISVWAMLQTGSGGAPLKKRLISLEVEEPKQTLRSAVFSCSDLPFDWISTVHLEDFPIVEYLGSGKNSSYWGVKRAPDQPFEYAYSESSLALDSDLLEENIEKLKKIKNSAAALINARGVPNVVGFEGLKCIESGFGIFNIKMIFNFHSGVSLREFIDSGKTRRLTENQILDLTSQLCNAVVGVHEAGAVHRDIKPENILVGKDLKLVLIDFGEGCGDRCLSESSFTLRGTSPYFHPQLIVANRDPLYQLLEEGERRFSLYKRQDYWALGTTLLELVDARRPYWLEEVEAAGDIAGFLLLSEMVTSPLTEAGITQFKILNEVRQRMVRFERGPVRIRMRRFLTDLLKVQASSYDESRVIQACKALKEPVLKYRDP